MSRTLTKAVLLLFILPLYCLPAVGQYYDWGQEPASVKWEQIKTRDIRYIFPDYYRTQAIRTMHYLDTIRPHINYGFRHGPLQKMPLVMHTNNFQSNGLVMLAPRRMEFIMTPSASSPAFPWHKQLAVHEYRHAVQYGNLNRNVIKWLGWILGEQGSMVGLALIPVWAIEGDAVKAETEMSTYGRGLQPSFTIEYRAYALDGGKRFRPDKYFSGSYKNYMPDHYQLGYQMTDYAYTRYGENVWDKVADLATRRPYYIATTYFGLKKFYGTDATKLLRDTFDDLEQFWKSLPREEDTSQRLPVATKFYTTYSSPIIHGEKVLSMKTSLDRANAIVLTDPGSGAEQVLHRTGVVNTPMTMHSDVLYWTEYRRSLFWDQSVRSVLCSYDLTTRRGKALQREGDVLFPASAGDHGLALVRYDRSGYYTLETGNRSLQLPDTMTVHGLDYDQLTDRLYFIALSDSGMYICGWYPEDLEFKVVTRPGFSSLSNLRADNGALYYNSIYSGKDEIHCYDLSADQEYRITTSRFGSFTPSVPDPGGRMMMSTYSLDGYILSQQTLDRSQLIPVADSRMPVNKVNPPRKGWDLPNVDLIVAPDSTPRSITRYRKAGHIFNFHSWGPIWFDADKITTENEFDISAGVTLLSQNNLNSAFSQVGYAWSEGYSHIRGKFSYYGWAPRFELEAEWSNRKQYYYMPSYEDGTRPERPTDLNTYFNMNASVYLPLTLSAGYHYRRLTPLVEYEFVNNRFYNPSGGYYTGLHKTTFSIQYTDNVRMAYRDFLPRWGYAVRGGMSMNPVRTNFGKLWHVYGRIYAPGFGPHHSVMLRGAGQYQQTSTFNFNQKLLLPRGARQNFSVRRYAAASLDYQFPVWYPDWGWNSFVWIKRVRVNLFGDFARYESITRNAAGHHITGNKYSYGLDLNFDLSPLRLPASNTCVLSLSLYKPNDSSGPKFGFAFSIPI